MDITFHFIGWNCKTERDGTEHDKIYVGFKLGRVHYTAWGARGKALSFKKYNSCWDMDEILRKKRKTYCDIDKTQLCRIWPTFDQTVEERLFFATLADTIR